MKNSLIVAGICVVAFASTGAMAADDKVPTTNGFYGNIIFGVGYLDLESNLLKGNKLLDVENETISSVFQAPDSESDTYPFVTGEFGWTFGDRWQAYFGNDIGNLVTLDFSQRLGIRKAWDGVGVVGIAALLSGLPAEVWEDPYLAGTPRSDTDRDSTGVGLDWWRILDSGFFLQLKTREIDIDNEQSGTDPALGLTPAEINQLRRDGDDSRITLGYRWEDGKNTWQPELVVGEDDRDGEAVSADVTGLKLTYSFAGELWTMIATGSFFKSDYDQANPIYGQKIDSDAYALGFTAFRKLDWGGGGWSVFGSLAYGDEDSDVNFHDGTATGVNLGAAYRFGTR
jgi:hypothetical protein